MSLEWKLSKYNEIYKTTIKSKENDDERINIWNIGINWKNIMTYVSQKENIPTFHYWWIYKKLKIK